MKGFIISCVTGKEKFAIKEIYNILNDYVDKIYPDIQTEIIENEDQINKKVKLTDDLLQQELAQIREQKVKIFYNQDIGIKKGIIFIKINEIFKDKICVYQICDKIMSDIHQNQVILGNKWFFKLQNSLKLIPVQLLLRADVEIFKQNIIQLIQQHLPKEESVTWQFEFKCRFNEKLKQKMFLDEIIEHIGKQNRVDFKNPQFTIYTDISKHFMLMSVLKNWTQYRKYSMVGLNSVKQNNQLIGNQQQNKQQNQDILDQNQNDQDIQNQDVQHIQNQQQSQDQDSKDSVQLF